MKLNDITIVIIIFIIISFLLSVLNIVSISFLDILSYSLITIGISLVFSEVMKQNRFLIFVGSIIFLVGIFFIITENFDVHIKEGVSLAIILLFSGSGLLVVFISTSTTKIYLLASFILLSTGLILFLINSNWKIGSFIQSLFPVANFLWPIVLIIVVLFFVIRLK